MTSNLVSIIYYRNLLSHVKTHFHDSRCLLLQKANPVKWTALTAMEAHNDMRRARGDIWPVNQKNVVQRIKKWGLQYDDQEIHTVCGILEVRIFIILRFSRTFATPTTTVFTEQLVKNQKVTIGVDIWSCASLNLMCVLYLFLT